MNARTHFDIHLMSQKESTFSVYLNINPYYSSFKEKNFETLLCDTKGIALKEIYVATTICK